MRSKFLCPFSRLEYEMLDKDSRPCQEGQNIADFVKCFKRDFVTKLSKIGQNCLPILGYGLFASDYPNITLCKDGNASFLAYKMLTQLLSDYSMFGYTDIDRLQCKLPCNSESITAYTSILQNGDFSKYIHT